MANVVFFLEVKETCYLIYGDSIQLFMIFCHVVWSNTPIIRNSLGLDSQPEVKDKYMKLINHPSISLIFMHLPAISFYRLTENIQNC